MKKIKFIFVVFFVFISIKPVMAELDEKDILAIYNNYIYDQSFLNEMTLKNLLLLETKMNDETKQMFNYINKECLINKTINNIKSKKKYINSISELQNFIKSLYSDEMLTCVENTCRLIDYMMHFDNLKEKAINTCMVNIQEVVHNKYPYTQISIFCNCFVNNKIDFINKNYDVIKNNNETQCKNIVWEAEQYAGTKCVMKK